MNIGARFNQEEGDTDDEEDEHKSKDANKTDYVPQSKRPRTTNFLSKFLLDGHSMFESRELQQDIDDYGATIDDLTFRDINPIDRYFMNYFNLSVVLKHQKLWLDK